LRLTGKLINIPIYFVLGNHDYYGDTIEITKKKVAKFVKHSTNLCWLLKQEISNYPKTLASLGMVAGQTAGWKIIR
jgi:predicted MPP superfamily phosphohydrolase